ncbi:gasdermin-E-like [Salvelinus sp. IW2-2015]|uniref:gasdermin-E-like n=1 Tax=Salvelinus sp. IW2-2015 TaxID=2691554 RepID=UPI0038D41B30
MKQSGSTQTDSDVSLGIPANTVMAYSLIELYVKCNGQFELCLICNNGGFEKVWSKDEIEGDGIMDLRGDFAANSHLNLNKELEKLSGHFQLLSALPVAKRSSLLQLLKTTMEDREAVSVLESVLDQMCDGETPDLSDLEESERETVQAILDLVDQCVGKDEDEIRSSLLSAVHLIVSAMDGMTDEGLSVACYQSGTICAGSTHQVSSAPPQSGTSFTPVPCARPEERVTSPSGATCAGSTYQTSSAPPQPGTPCAASPAQYFLCGLPALALKCVSTVRCHRNWLHALGLQCASPARSVLCWLHSLDLRSVSSVRCNLR